MDIIHQSMSFRDNFVKFVVDNGIAGTAAGVSIAISTKDVITSFVGDILIPLIYLLLIRINSTAVNVLPTNTKINCTAFIQHFITWVFVVIITFLFIQYFFNNMLGISEVKKMDDTKKKEGFGSHY